MAEFTNNAQQDPTSFCYDTIVKEEVIIEDELKEEKALSLHHQEGCEEKKVLFPEEPIKEENGIFKVQCKLCLLSFANKKLLEKHLAVHKNRPVDASSKESENGGESKYDPATDDGGSGFKCTVCKKSFKDKRWLNQHIKRHEAIKEGKFPCVLCDTRCGTKQELIRHEEIHARKQQTEAVSNEKVPPIILERNSHTVYKCPECALIFEKLRVYFTHAQSHINVRNGTFRCEICGNCYPNKKNLKRHQARHLEGKSIKRRDNFSFECPECGKKFAQKRYLTKHVQIHEAVEKGSFQCEICARYCGSRKLLLSHQKVHGTSEELKCPECDKICANKRYLTRHLQRHEAKRSGLFECTVCGKKLGSKYHFDWHTNKHCQIGRNSSEMC